MSERTEHVDHTPGQDPSPTHAGHGTPPGYMSRKDDYGRRMRRIEGQVRGISKMIEDEKYCIDILTQVSAVTKALQAVSLGLLDEHMSHCVLDAAQTGGPEADAKLKEASDAIARLVRS
jgi:CsoR family transcriptional regulator, copper-sensing transcriptional repressor